MAGSTNSATNVMTAVTPTTQPTMNATLAARGARAEQHQDDRDDRHRRDGDAEGNREEVTDHLTHGHSFPPCAALRIVARRATPPVTCNGGTARETGVSTVAKCRGYCWSPSRVPPRWVRATSSPASPSGPCSCPSRSPTPASPGLRRSSGCTPPRPHWCSTHCSAAHATWWSPPCRRPPRSRPASSRPFAHGATEYVALTTALALVTGVVALVAGLIRLGFLASMISEPVLKGFIIGLALTILVGQLPKLFGVEKGERQLLREALGPGHPPRRHRLA